MEKVFTGISHTVVKELKARHDIRYSLAIERTILANERTLMSYSRTSLTLFVAGVSFLHFTEVFLLHIIGYIFIPIGLYTFIFGYYRFNKKKNGIRKERDMLDKMLYNEYCKIPPQNPQFP
jgi:putative membrane protein